ncbi:MAG TPA: PorV/PorQ family protein [Candidatus Acidoferrales bacterium]|nr:PorV/PorQ family protein [Candidatus Acidoferrales bacterium]
MKKKINFLAAALLLSSFTVPGFAQQKLAQSGFQFLSVVSDAHGAAMADAMTSLPLGSSSLFFNPAGMTGLNGVVDLSGSTNKWIAGITHNTFSLEVNPANGRYGVIGFSLQYVNYGDIYETIVGQGPQGYEDLGIYHLTAYAAGLGYAKQLTEQFSLGGQIKLIHQDLGPSTIPLPGGTGNDTSQTASNKLSPIVFDFGTQFKTGVKSLVFGMSVRNFSQQVKYVDEGFQAPLAFSLGISMNLLDLAKSLPFNQSLLMSLDASHYTDRPEEVNVGLDYCLLDMLSLRAGYTSGNAVNDEGNGLSYGVGFSKFGLSIDYAYTPFGDFGNIQRFTVRFSR